MTDNRCVDCGAPVTCPEPDAVRCEPCEVEYWRYAAYDRMCWTEAQNERRIQHQAACDRDAARFN